MVSSRCCAPITVLVLVSIIATLSLLRATSTTDLSGLTASDVGKLPTLMVLTLLLAAGLITDTLLLPLFAT